MTQFDDFDTQIQCEEVYPEPEGTENDPTWWTDNPHVIEGPDDGLEGLFDSNGGLTAEAFAFDLLAEMENNGEFV